MKALSVGAIFALLVATCLVVQADAGCRRTQCVKPNLKRQFIINQPYGEVMGSVLQSQLEDLEDSISMNERGNIQLENVPVGQRGVKIRKVEILEQNWEEVKVKCNLSTMALEGRAIGVSKIRIDDRQIGRLTFNVRHDMEVGSESTKLHLVLLNQISYQQARIMGCDGEVVFRKHGNRTLVETRFMFHAHVSVTRLFPRIVNSIAWKIAYNINCQSQVEMEKTIREAAARHKDDAVVIPTILRMLKNENLIPSDQIKKLKGEEVSARIWKNEKGEWQTEADLK